MKLTCDDTNHNYVLTRIDYFNRTHLVCSKCGDGIVR